MNTKEFFKTKNDRLHRIKAYSKQNVKKEVEKTSEALLKQIPEMSPAVSHELALYGYCLLVRQGDELLMANREHITIGFKNDYHDKLDESPHSKRFPK